MKFSLEFDMDNEEFQDFPETAISRALDSVRYKIGKGYQCGIIWDENGNSIGRFQIEGART